MNGGNDEAVCENEANGIGMCLICWKPNACHHQTMFQMKLRAGGRNFLSPPLCLPSSPSDR